MRAHNQIERDEQELVDARAVLEEAGERWIEAKAGNKPTAAIEREVVAAERAIQHIEARLNRRSV